MQNRFTIRPIPTTFLHHHHHDDHNNHNHHPTTNEEEEEKDEEESKEILTLLQEYIEDELNTWIDRIAYLPSSFSSSSSSSSSFNNNSHDQKKKKKENKRNHNKHKKEENYPNNKNGIVAIELSLENYTEIAIEHFTNHFISLSSSSSSSKVEFVVQTAKCITPKESVEFLNVCPYNGKEAFSFTTATTITDADMTNTNSPQIKIPSSNNKRRSCEGGTGAKPWRGGLLLSQALESSSSSSHHPQQQQQQLPLDLFRSKKILELGSGCFGLPSIMLASLFKEEEKQQQLLLLHDDDDGKEKDKKSKTVIVASDLVDEVMDQLRDMVRVNEVQEYVLVKQIDFYNLGNNSNNKKKQEKQQQQDDDDEDEDDERLLCKKEKENQENNEEEEEEEKYNVIMYADCVYSVKQGLNLASACRTLLTTTTTTTTTQRHRQQQRHEKHASTSYQQKNNSNNNKEEEGGIVLAMLPPFRVGIKEHVQAMTNYFGTPEILDLECLLSTKQQQQQGQQGQERLQAPGCSSSSSSSSSNNNNNSRLESIKNMCVEGGSGNGYQLLKWTLK